MTMVHIETYPTLTAAAELAVLALAERAAAVDGVFPLNEQAVIGLSANGCHRLAWQGGQLVGYAAVSDDTAQLVVDPAHRRQGLGRQLITYRLRPVQELWAFGDLPCGQGFCATHGFWPVRTLLVMEAAPVLPTHPANPPQGVRIGPYASGDLDELVELNARAFNDHPEQGRWVRDDFIARMALPWFDPAGLIIARTQSLMVGFHWTKAEHGDGEVYVIGVDPAWSGRGLGRALLDSGVSHLVERGVRSIQLWVDGDNLAATTLYEKSGFSVLRRDVRYRRHSDAHRN